MYETAPRDQFVVFAQRSIDSVERSTGPIIGVRVIIMTILRVLTPKVSTTLTGKSRKLKTVEGVKLEKNLSCRRLDPARGACSAPLDP